MRHNRKFNHLGRQSGHRKAMLSNMATSLILHKRIQTTVAKAKALKKYVEPLITKSKEDSTHSRRVVFSYLKSKEGVTELFREVAPKIAERPGGYTRILKTGTRVGDAAEMCIIELVDYNQTYVAGAVVEKGKTRRSRSTAKKAVDAEVVVETPIDGQAAAEPAKEKAPVKKAPAKKAAAPKQVAPKGAGKISGAKTVSVKTGISKKS